MAASLRENSAEEPGGRQIEVTLDTEPLALSETRSSSERKFEVSRSEVGVAGGSSTFYVVFNR